MQKGIKTFLIAIIIFLFGFFYQPSFVEAEMVSGFSCVYETLSPISDLSVSVYGKEKIQLSFTNGKLSTFTSAFDFNNDKAPNIMYFKNDNLKFLIENDYIHNDCPKYLFDITVKEGEYYRGKFGYLQVVVPGDCETLLVYDGGITKDGSIWNENESFVLENNLKILTGKRDAGVYYYYYHYKNSGKIDYTEDTETKERQYNVINIDDETTPIELICGGVNGVVNDEFLGFLNKYILTPIKYIMPVLFIIFTAIDFIKVVFSGDSKSLDKAWGNLIKRIVLLLSLFLVTEIVELIIKLFIGRWSTLVTTCNITNYS